VFGGGGVIRDIDIRTVSQTRRAAIENWLYLHGVPIVNNTPDHEIEMWWLASVKTNKGLAVVKVTVGTNDD
jgi:hypothetical protein